MTVPQTLFTLIDVSSSDCIVEKIDELFVREASKDLDDLFPFCHCGSCLRARLRNVAMSA